MARRYARALLEVAAESGASDRVAEQLEAIARLIQENEELAAILLNPAFTRSQRGDVLEAVINAWPGGLEPATANLLRLLADRNRLEHLPNIVRVYRDMADTRAGRMRGKVWSAVPLPVESLQKLRQALERITQRNVVLDTKVDPSLLGGVAAQVGSFVYDGSVRTQLEELRKSLVSR